MRQNAAIPTGRRCSRTSVECTLRYSQSARWIRCSTTLCSWRLAGRQPETAPSSRSIQAACTRSTRFHLHSQVRRTHACSNSSRTRASERVFLRWIREAPKEAAARSIHARRERGLNSGRLKTASVAAFLAACAVTQPARAQLVKYDREHVVTQHTDAFAHSPVIAMRDDGSYAIVWSSLNLQEPSRTGLFARIFDWNGRPRTDDFRVSSREIDAVDPAVAVLSNDDFVAAW